MGGKPVDQYLVYSKQDSERDALLVCLVSIELYWRWDCRSMDGRHTTHEQKIGLLQRLSAGTVRGEPGKEHCRQRSCSMLYSPSAEGTVKVELHDCETDGRVRILVTDNGYGIAPEDMVKL